MAPEPLLTICLLNYRRPGNLHRIIATLTEQTIGPRLFLWNNSGRPFKHPAIDWQVDSSRNILCPPRWWMGSFAETPFVASWDDDLIPTDARLFEDLVARTAEQPADRLVGLSGAVMRPGRHYRRQRRIRRPLEDRAADLVRGLCVVVRTETLRNAIRLGDLTGEIGREEDIVLSGALAAGRKCYHLIPGGFRGRYRRLRQGRHALRKRPGQKDLREAARRRWLAQ